MDVPPKLYMKPSYALNISGPEFWYSNINVEHYQVLRISHMRFSEGQYEDSTAVLFMGGIKWNIDDVAIEVYKWSRMGIIIALSIRIRSYRYWTRLSRISNDIPLKIHMKQYYALKIYGPVSWYSNVYGGTIREGGLPMWGFSKEQLGKPSCKGEGSNQDWEAISQRTWH